MRFGEREEPRSGHKARDAAGRRSAALALIAANADRFRRCGSVVETWRPRGGRRFGPYYRLAYRTAGGRQASFYLGADRAVAEAVAAELKRLRAPDAARRSIRRARAVVRRALAESRAELGRRLAPLALQVHGSEIRGWRSRRSGTSPDAGAGRGGEGDPERQRACSASDG